MPWALAFLTLGIPAASHAGVPSTAEYDIRFQATWSAASHPIDFPTNPHFSPLIGGVHGSEVSFWGEGELASEAIERMAEAGQTEPLAQLVEQAIQAGTAFETIRGGEIGRSPGATSVAVRVTREFPLVTLVSMIAPSPDWFVGVHGLSLFESGNWVQQKVITLYAYDSGTDSGLTYRAANDNTVPPEPIQRLETGPFVNPQPVGTFTFTRTDGPPADPLFLNGGRFRIEATWQDFQGAAGNGNPFQLTDDTGYFWFFDQSNVEVVIKVLSGCSFNDHFWVFAGGLTNVDVVLTVEDTETGQVNIYSNTLGQAFQPIQDTAAFATCP